MAGGTQTFENHRRWLAPWHFFVMPVMLANVIVVAKRAVAGPTFATGWDIVVAVALFLGLILARYMPLVAQNRVIRLEERTRLGRILPDDMRGMDDGLTPGQYIALRFAPDEEVPELVRRIRSGELKTSGDIKRAIRNWRGDHMRV
jgi:hypothetical protein